jgi:hypothetical protein
MPPALRILRKLESIIRAEIENIGKMASDRCGRDMILAMTHEEVVASAGDEPDRSDQVPVS